MDDILSLNQEIFGTKPKEKRMSKEAKKAFSKDIIVPNDVEVVTYEEGYNVDGGAILQIAGLGGFFLSLTCKIILWLNSELKWGLNFIWKGILKTAIVVGDVVSIASGMANISKNLVYNGLAAVMSKMGILAKHANEIAAGISMFALHNDLNGIFD